MAGVDALGASAPVPVSDYCDPLAEFESCPPVVLLELGRVRFTDETLIIIGFLLALWFLGWIAFSAGRDR